MLWRWLRIDWSGPLTVERLDDLYRRHRAWRRRWFGR